MAQEDDERECDGSEGRKEGEAEEAASEGDVGSVATSEGLVPICEAGARRLRIVESPGEEDVEKPAQGVLVEEFVVGCQLPEGGEDEEEVVAQEGW